ESTHLLTHHLKCQASLIGQIPCINNFLHQPSLLVKSPAQPLKDNCFFGLNK
ncbi:wd repeat-containing protein 46, partial [Moniliophthora roreri]